MEEQSKKIIKMMMKVQADDLKDAEMLADYSEKMRHAGHTAMAQRLMSRAKMRASHYMEDDKEIRDMMDRMKGSGEDAPQSVQAQCLEMMMETQRERYHHLMAKLEG